MGMTRRATGITQADVAEKAGVTVMTLSRYFRTPEKVARTTRQRIAAAIQDLGYVGDATAARLAGQASPMLSVIVPSLGLPYAADVFAEISLAAEARGAAVMAWETNFNPERQERLIERALSWRPTGIIHLGDTPSERSRRTIAANATRFVEAGSYRTDAIDVSVGVSNSAASRALSEAVFASYDQPVAFAVRRSGYDLEREREAGYRAAAAATGRPALVIAEGNEAPHFETGAKLLSRAQEIVGLRAVIFAGDYLATGALFEAQRRGIKVPHDVAVCGMGNYAIAPFTVPPLTTIDMPTKKIATLAVSACFDEPVSAPVAAELIARQSCPLAIS